MKKIYFLALLLASFQNAYFQTVEKNKSIDSLIVLVNKTKVDTTKIGLYHQICKKFYPEEPSRMMYFNGRILELSKKNNYTKGYGLYYLNLTDIDYLNGDFTKAIADGEKAYAILSKTKDVKNHLNAASYLAYAYLDNYENKKARDLLLKNLPLAHLYANASILGRMYLFLGESYDDDIASIEELKSYKKSLYYYNKTNDIIGKVSLYQRIAAVYKKIHLYDEALKYLNLAEDEKPDEYNYNIIQIEKARVYNRMERYTEANSLALKNEVSLTKNQQNSSDAYWVNKLCLAISNFGLKKYDLAVKDCKAILATDIDNDTKMSTLNILANSYLKLNNLKESKRFIDSSLSLVSKVNNHGIEDVYKIKSELDEALGNYKSALEYSKKYNLLNVERNEKINQNKIEHLQVDFEVAEKENKIRKLQITDLQKTLAIEKQNKYLLTALFVIGIATMLIIAFIKVTKSINKRNQKIAAANIELSKASLMIQKSLSEKELLLKEIHHRVKNNLQLVMSLLNIQAREGTANDIKEFLEKGQSRIISMALIHENLYQTDRLDKVIFQDYIENLITNINLSFNDHNSKIKNDVHAENINFDIQTSIPLGLIINELYCNILKHAFTINQEGNVSIELTEVAPKDFQLKVSDNGKGINKTTTTKKTLGIELVHLLVDQLKGTIKCYQDNGTTYCINFKEIA